MNNVVHNWSWVYWRWSAFCGWWGETSGNYGTCPCDWSMILLMMCTNPLLPKRDTFRWMSLVSSFAHYFNLAWCAYIYVCLLYMWGGRWFWSVSRPLLDFLDVWEVWRGWCWGGPCDDVGGNLMNCIFLMFIHHPVTFSEAYISMYNVGNCVNIGGVLFDWSYVACCCELLPSPLVNYMAYCLSGGELSTVLGE